MRVNRRELIAAFLGTAALSGCRKSQSERLPPGELVGASDSLGHRLRQRIIPEVADDRWKDVDVVIVGAGVAGLSAARALKRAGINDFVILEVEPRAGGTSASGSSRGIGYPWGAHYVPAPTRDNPELIKLLRELDVFDGEDEFGDPIVAEQFAVRDPDERVFYKGHWYEGLYLHSGASAKDLLQLKRFEATIAKWADWRDRSGRRAFAVPLSQSTTDSEVLALDRMTADEWLAKNNFTSPRLRWLVDYGCRDDYGMSAAHTSAWAALFYFASRKPAANRESRPFITWPEGNGRLVRHLRSYAKDRIELGWAVADINPIGDDQNQQLEVRAISESAASGYRARKVIFAAPQFVLPYVFRPYRDRSPKFLREFEYGSWMVANITQPRRNEPAFENDMPMAWDNVLYESPSLGYVSASYQARVDYGPEIWTYYFPLAGDNPRSERQRLLQADRDEWAEVLLRDLEPAHSDLRERADRIDVMRWGHAMIRPRPGFVSSVARRSAARPIRGVHFAHSDLSGVALFEEAFDHGTRAAEEVRADIRDRSHESHED